jgi:hypothetical protein
MQQTLRKIGSVIGTAVMLGSTLAGAALATDLSDFYDGIAVVDGEADNTLLVVGTGGSSPSGLAQDVVSAIGVAAEIAQNAVTTTGGTGDITLSVESETVDGKELPSQIGRWANASLTQNNLTFYADGRGGTTLKTLKYKNVKDSGGNDVINEEQIYLGSLQTWLTDYQQGNLVKSSTPEAGYDKTSLTVSSPQTGWLTYTTKFESPIRYAKLKGQKMTFLGKDYTVLSASANTMKIAGAGLEQTIAVGDDGLEFEDYTVRLKSVLVASTSAEEDKALVEVEKDGVVDSKLVTEGTTENIGGLEVTVTAAASAVGQDTTMGSANILLGGNALTLKHNLGFPKNTDWTVEITTGTDSSYTGSPKTGISKLDLKYSKGLTSTNALGPGDDFTALEALGDEASQILSMRYDGLDSATRKDLTMTAGNQYKLDNLEYVYSILVTYPDKVFPASGSQVDTLYVSLENTGNVTDYELRYLDTTTNNFTQAGAANQQLSFAVGDKYYKISANRTTISAPDNSTSAFITIQEPERTYPLGQSNTGAYFYAFIDRSTNQTFCDYSASTVCTDILNYTGTTQVFTSDRVSYVDSNTATKFKSDFISMYGTKVAAADTSTIKLALPASQTKTKVTIGSAATTTETAEAELGGDAVTIGGVDIKATGVAGGTAVNDWPMPVAKVDKDLTDADKMKNLVVLGGPLVNSVTATIATNYPDDVVITNDDPGVGKGKVIVVDDPFASGEDNIAVVVAGSDRQGTTAAAQLLQTLDQFTITGEMATVQYTAAGSAPTLV